MKSILIWMMCMFFLFLSCAKIPRGEAGKQIPFQYYDEGVSKDSVKYLLYLPQDYDEGDTLWPLLFFLHGRGERGSDINLVKTHGPPKLIEEGKSFPFLVVSPQCPLSFQEWNWRIVDGLLTEIEKNYRVDPARIYLTGLSMGGYGSWTWAMHRPDRFAALAPICGWGDPVPVCALKDMPVWTFHGVKDKVIPIQKTENLVDPLRKCGGNVKFTIYPDANHDSWTETYNNTELYRWLLEQRKPD